MSEQGTLFRTPAGEAVCRWEISDLPGSPPGVARGWVDVGRGVGRIERPAPGAPPSEDPAPGVNRRLRAALLDELGRRYPGVRWFEDREGSEPLT